MDLDVVLPNESPSMPVGALRDLAREAEDLGFATAWLPDHVLPPGPYGPEFGGVLEPLVTIGHLAAVTERLRFGTSVLVAPLRNPFVLAKQAATLQELSGGRLLLGLGAGWSREEFDAVGADHAHRGAVTEDVLALLRHLFSGGGAPYTGRRFSYEQGVFAPLLAVPVPLVVGGQSDAALRRAARYGDAWQGMATTPARYTRLAGRLADLAGDREVAATVRLEWGGGVDELAERVTVYREAGATRVAVHLGEHERVSERMAALVRALGG